MGKKYIIVCVCCLLLLVTMESEDFDQIDPLGPGERYHVYTDEYIPREELSIYLIANNKIVLFFDYTGLVNVYTLEGEFLYGLRVESLKNGIGDIAYDRNYIYIKSRGNTMYIFQGTTLVNSFRKNDDPVLYESIKELMDGEPNHSLNNSVYSYNSASNSIQKREGRGAFETVLDMPDRSEDNYYLALVICFLVAALAYPKLVLLRKER